VHLRRLTHSHVVNVTIAEPDITGDRSTEQVHVLQDESER